MAPQAYLVKVELEPSDVGNILHVVELVNEAFRQNIRFRKDHHCTLTFATSWKREPTVNAQAKYCCLIDRVDVFGEAVVLVLAEQHQLRKRNAELLLEMDGVDQFSPYNPHVTIGYLTDGELLCPETKNYLEQSFCGKLFSFLGEKAKPFAIQK